MSDIGTCDPFGFDQDCDPGDENAPHEPSRNDVLDPGRARAYVAFWRCWGESFTRWPRLWRILHYLGKKP